MIIKCLVTKRVWSCTDYQILGCVLTEPNENVILNNYGNFSVKDSTMLLNEGKEYTIDCVETEYRGQKQYILNTIPSLMFSDVEEIDSKKEMEILTNITTENQAKNINEAYPNFVRLILSGKENEIDVTKIKNVGETRFRIYKREINDKYKYYHLMISFPKYDLSLSDCKDLCEAFVSVEDSIEQLSAHPYHCLIDICGKNFKKIDKIIVGDDNKWKQSEERVEYLMLDILIDNQLKGSTYMDANELGEYVNGYDSSLLKLLKPIAIDSNKIYYDNNEKTIARMDTYLAECNIASFIEKKLENNNNQWDIDWSKYTEVDGFKLTKDQANVLDNICKYDFSLLLGFSGTGKTSAMKSVVQMLEDNDKSYVLLAPTGKASARLSETTGRTASTMHRYIGQHENICTDVLIVDEFSFFGTEWANMLFNAIINPDIKILLVGDNAQLNPISHGRVFSDIIDSNRVPMTTLTDVFRYAEGGISKVATDIRNGKSYFNSSNINDDIVKMGKDFKFIDASDDDIEDIVINEYCQLLNKGVDPTDITCISPFNVGSIGCYNLNNSLQGIINPIKPNEPCFTYKVKRNNKEYEITLKKGDYVMNTKNDYNAIPYEKWCDIEFEEHATERDITEFTSVFNGDCGKIVSCDNDKLVVNFDNELVVYPPTKISQLILAMVITAHKMQGSQSKYIINIVSPSHQRMLTRNLLYVADTRATQNHIEIGSKTAVEKALNIKEDNNRKTFLLKLLTKGDIND